MKKIILFIIFSAILVNITVYMSLKINDYFFYILVNLFIVILNLLILRINKLENLIQKIELENEKYFQDQKAEDHPIIQSARKRLGK